MTWGSKLGRAMDGANPFGGWAEDLWLGALYLVTAAMMLHMILFVSFYAHTCKLGELNLLRTCHNDHAR